MGTGRKPFFLSAYVPEANGERVACPPTPGRDWSGPLYEEFQILDSSLSSKLATRLGIRSDLAPDSAPTKYGFDYCLSSRCSAARPRTPPVERNPT
jgi:hypothetical protein